MKKLFLTSIPGLPRRATALLLLCGFALLAAPPVADAGGASETPNASAADTEETPGEQPVLRIVATTTQASDLARILTAGVDGVEITGLMGAGVDPHLYQPTEGDIQALNRAQVVIYNGLNLEGQFDRVFQALREQGITIFALTGPVDRAGFVMGAEDGPDPHIWFDPRNWILVTEALGELLAERHGTGRERIMANADAYTRQLEALYDWAVTGMESVAEERRLLVTSHDAFQYFGTALGWRVAAIQGLSTEDEAGVGDVQDIVDTVSEAGIPVLFVESSIPPDTIQAVQEAVAAAGGTVDVGIRELYSDAMGAGGTFSGTYIGMFAENVLTILQSYGCAGEPVEIPSWPAGLTPDLPQELRDAACR